MRGEPGLRVFLVRVGAKSWIRQKIIRGPLPDIADHLAATEGAVTGFMHGNFDETAAAPVEIGVLRFGAIIAPRVMAAPRRQHDAIRRGFASGCHFPFRFRGQAPAGPIAEGFGFEPTHMHHR